MYSLITKHIFSKKWIISFLLLISVAYADAVNDTYTTPYGVTLNGNVLDNDTGDSKLVSSYTVPSCGTITNFTRDGSFTYNPGTCSGTVTFTYTMYWLQSWGWFSWWRSDSATVTITITNTGTPPTISGKPLPDRSATLNASFSLDIDATEPDGDTITYSASNLPPGLYIDATTGIISGTPTTVGTYTVTVTATDKDGSDSDTFSITVEQATQANAVDDSYTTSLNTSVSGNVTDNDAGSGIYVSSHTNPTNGTLVLNNDGTFTYTPNTGFNGTDTFTYTITDSGGNTSSATVTITVNIETEFERDGSLGFTQLNPQSTQNIIGNYIMTGNTVLCLTDKTSGYPDDSYICQDSTDIGRAASTSNNYVAKYIDIDDDPMTWNSSSANITLPESYDQQGGNGILWAGLVWQGRFAWQPDVEELRYYTEGSTGPIEHRTGDGTRVTSVDINTDAHANLIRFKIDNGTYQQVQAYKVYSKTSSDGTTYSAVADVTSLLRSANLAKGQHTFTVANLPTSEGREYTPGIYGGWSLVIIYAEDILVGKPRNITIYGGMLEMWSSSTTVEISGFKLPSSGQTVSAQLSLFSGEGEYDYTEDGVDIGLTSRGPWTAIPETGNNTNVFDAKLSNVDRDHIDGKYNDLQNNNTGIDVDVFDISNIVSGYSRDTTSFWLRLWADEYVIPGMLAFSTELYQPNICYDYTVAIGNYLIPSVDNNITTSYGKISNDPLTIRVSIKSLEGDFDLNDVNVSYRIHDTDQLRYITDSTMISLTGTYAYVDASAQTTNQTSSGFTLYIGKGAGPDQGGTISAYETRYFKFDNEMLKAVIETGFDLYLNYTVNYGSGDLYLTKILTSDDICKENYTYAPQWGIFNISSSLASTNANNFGEPYNLYTQIANRKFDAKIFSYDADYTTPKEVNTTIEVEVFNADFFPRDTNLSCNNPDSNLSAPVFVDFDAQSYVDLTGLEYNFAARNVGFRIWYLTDPDGAFVNFRCNSQDDDTCFRQVYADYYSGDTFCDGVDDYQAENCSATGRGCYQCLRKYYGKPICSRDNFAIRPEAFVTEIKDSDQSYDATQPTNLLANSRSNDNSANIVAGYQYRFDINATNYDGDNATPGYIQTFSSTSANAVALMKWSPKNGRIVSGCNDTNDHNITIVLFNGTSFPAGITVDNDNNTSIEQVGEYDFALYDSNWTAVDWYALDHHNQNGFESGSDCQENSTLVTLEGDGTKKGCLTSSIHIHPAGWEYKALELRYYPYDFNVSGLALSSGPAPDQNASFIYMNMLDDETVYPLGYADRSDENMSYNIQGTFFASSFSGTKLTNFVNNCYADNVAMTLRHKILSSDMQRLTAELRDYNTSNPTITVYPTDGTYAERITSLPQASAQNTLSPLTVDQSASNFEKTMEGAISMDLGFNIDRTLNQPINPVYVSFTDFNITDKDAPDLSVEMKTNHKIFGLIDINPDQNVTFIYGWAKPNKFIYDNVTDTSIITPVSVVAYCDLGLTECQNRGLTSIATGLLSDAVSDISGWWIVQNHNNSTVPYGQIYLTSGTNGSVSPADPTPLNLTNGIDQSVTVTKSGTATTPTSVMINLGSNTARWLIYNPQNNTVPVPFYRVRFIGTSGWTGYGQTGHVVDDDINIKKSRRLEW